MSRVPKPLLRAAGRLRERTPVSVVVLVTDDSSIFLPECIASLAAQTRRPTEILLVVTGTGRDTATVVRREGVSWRVDVLELPDASDATAFNEGVAATHRDFVLLLTAGDRLTPEAIARLLASDADLAGGEGAVPTHPVLYRRSFWDRARLAVPDGPWATFQPQADGMLRDGTTARELSPLLQGPTRGTGRGFSSLPVLAPYVEGWVDAVRWARGVKGFDEWILRTEVPDFLTDAETCTPAQWQSLSGLVRDLQGQPLTADARVQVHLAREDRQEDLARFNAARWQEDGFPVRVQEGLTYAILPVDDVPAELVRTPRPAPRPVWASQRLLQQWYAEADHVVDPSLVYFQAYQGAVTDSPLAIHEELRRTHPGLRTVWAVAGESTEVPDGAEAVLIRSREWYAALATAAHIVTNADLDRWFVKRPGQRVLQTYHGYPSKAMGIGAWRSKGFTPLRIERQLRRTSGTWDLLLTPSAAMDAHYREQYRYDGEILAAGYPRDDVLVGPSAPTLREKARQELGIGDRTAVLYAPTWRDDLATNFRAAPMGSIFDAEQAAAELGSDFVILLRGHRFHRHRPDLGDRILDVTDHPEINDLILAADAAVLDYSSLRFDFSLTGRPMVFLVPDLDRYAGSSRGFLYDFRTTAPGPLVDDTDEVIAALKDLPGVVARHAEDYRRFHEEFNHLQDGHAAERVVEAFFAG
jgi:CDP-glycerol glycerophosphotransferase (TagB/SpsB family)/glycosyltransferase involved in cell wall biosynthesis